MSFFNPTLSGAGQDLPYQAVWRNPKGYNGDGLIIPFRFQKGAFTDQQEADITNWINELSGYLNSCIRFVDDTRDKKYSKDYIFVRAYDENGNWLKGDCSSNVGNITKYYKREYQMLTLSIPQGGGHCIWKKTVQHEFMHALGFFHEHQRPDRDQSRGFIKRLYLRI